MPALMDIFTDWENKSKKEVEDARWLWSQAYAIPGAGAAFRWECKKILEFVLIGSWQSHFFVPGLIQMKPHARDQLAVRMFRHYLNSAGQDFTLTLADMKAMNIPTKSMNGTGAIKTPQIDIRNKNEKTVNPDFAAACGRANISASGKGEPYSGKLLWGWDNGAISTYTVNYTGTISSAMAMGGFCTWTGTVEFVDRFDMDPIWGWSPQNQGGRVAHGERRTRIGYILNLGTDFDVKSPKAKVSQGENDLCITFL
jgi:hypothetical protein